MAYFAKPSWLGVGRIELLTELPLGAGRAVEDDFVFAVAVEIDEVSCHSSAAAEALVAHSTQMKEVKA